MTLFRRRPSHELRCAIAEAQHQKDRADRAEARYAFLERHFCAILRATRAIAREQGRADVREAIADAAEYILWRDGTSVQYAKHNGTHEQRGVKVR